MKKGINVISLFDGISCGQEALTRASIPVDKYFASEVDKYAIQIATKNHPETIQLGSVIDWQDWDMHLDWSSIDLLMGGSPCQGFSFAGKQLNFEDPRSKLFFVYVEILEHIKKHNPNVKYLLENVKMKKEFQDVISGLLGVEPIEINSALVSAQNRKRLYWTNIPSVTQPRDSKNTILIGDIKLKIDQVNEIFYLSEKALSGIFNSSYSQQRNCIVSQNEKCKTLRARDYKGAKVIQEQDGRYRYLTPIEYERLQTLPDGYTEGVSNSQRYKCLGNGWTVDIITHILRELMEEDKW